VAFSGKLQIVSVRRWFLGARETKCADKEPLKTNCRRAQDVDLNDSGHEIDVIIYDDLLIVVIYSGTHCNNRQTWKLLKHCDHTPIKKATSITSPMGSPTVK
jgi:hypothetical protein